MTLESLPFLLFQCVLYQTPKSTSSRLKLDGRAYSVPKNSPLGPRGQEKSAVGRKTISAIPMHYYHTLNTAFE